jgi:hypothetical protein
MASDLSVAKLKKADGLKLSVLGPKYANWEALLAATL